jgi:hypothetical protein
MYSLRRLNSDNFFYPANEAAAKARDLPRLKIVSQETDSFSWDQQRKKKKKKKKRKQAAALSGRQQQKLERTIRSPRPIFNIRPTKCPVTTAGHAQLHSFPLFGTKIFLLDIIRH